MQSVCIVWHVCLALLAVGRLGGAPGLQPTTSHFARPAVSWLQGKLANFGTDKVAIRLIPCGYDVCGASRRCCTNIGGVLRTKGGIPWLSAVCFYRQSMFWFIVLYTLACCNYCSDYSIHQIPASARYLHVMYVAKQPPANRPPSLQVEWLG